MDTGLSAMEVPRRPGRPVAIIKVIRLHPNHTACDDHFIERPGCSNTKRSSMTGCFRGRGTGWGSARGDTASGGRREREPDPPGRPGYLSCAWVRGGLGRRPAVRRGPHSVSRSSYINTDIYGIILFFTGKIYIQCVNINICDLTPEPYSARHSIACS